MFAYYRNLVGTAVGLIIEFHSFLMGFCPLHPLLCFSPAFDCDLRDVLELLPDQER